MATLLPFPSSKARVRAMSSANRAEVPGGKGLASMVSKLETTAYPALLFPSKTKLLLSMYQTSSGLVRGSSVQFSSVAQSCLTLCDPMNCSTTGLPVHHQLPEFTQTHVHRVSDAIQPAHSLSSPSPPALNPSQHQGLFQ